MKRNKDIALIQYFLWSFLFEVKLTEVQSKILDFFEIGKNPM